MNPKECKHCVLYGAELRERVCSYRKAVLWNLDADVREQLLKSVDLCMRRIGYDTHQIITRRVRMIQHAHEPCEVM